VNVYFAPQVENAYYARLASQDPAHITVLDGGTFLRDGQGQYQWRMPCTTREAGCDAKHTVGVRWTDGFHFCTDPAYGTRGTCPDAASRAGERRVAAAIATELFSSLETTNTPSSHPTR